MIYCGFDDLLFLLYLHRHVLLTKFSWVCRTLDVRGCRGIDETPWNLDRVREWIVRIWMLLMWHMYIWLDIMMLIGITNMFRWWMQADDSLPTRLTSGVKGSCTTTRDIEGEVWQQPCHNLLAFMSWLEPRVNYYLVREYPWCREGGLWQSLMMILRGAQ